MRNITKLVIAVTGLLVAAGTLIGALRAFDSTPNGVTIILNSPEAYEDFLSNHPVK